MPKRADIKKILIIGSGPIVIGQACEFDYSGTQACQALRALGYEVVLVNSNPATIMTDTQMADATYIEPLNLEKLTEIINIERPDALLPNFGGQTGLNLSMQLEKAGVLEQYGVEVIGVNLGAIERGEDRIIFKEMMSSLGIGMPRSEAANTPEQAVEAAARMGYPCVVRPAFTMGGTGGGVAYDPEELREIASRGIAASLVDQVLIEESVLGWEELELEIVRDKTGHAITICFIENIDAMGVHTGDSICCAPMLNVSESVMKQLQEYAYKIVSTIGVIGGCNCQFAYNTKDGRIVIIEINPRTSRSSALASKATGFPIARVSAQLAVGVTLSELPYWRGGTLDKYEPYGDYVVVKFPRWAFEKFPQAKDRLGPQMKAVGEVMSIGQNYKEAMQKAVRSLENGRFGLGFVNNYNDLTKDELIALLSRPSSERFFMIYEAMRKGASVDELYSLTHIKPYFLTQMMELVELEEKIIACRGGKLPDDLLIQAKKDGFSDNYLAKLLGISEDTIRKQRTALGMVKGWGEIQVSGVDDEVYYYSTYLSPPEAEAPQKSDKVLILGGGPNRIGQGIEFDYCCVHAAYALRDLGYSTVMVNCNPETVSTDYDTADRLYFEPLTVEDVMAIVEHEKPMGAIVQFGGQTPLNIASQLKALGVPILGTSPVIIDAAEDRDLFREVMKKLDIPMPENGMAKNVQEAVAAANRIGYPLMVRPSFVLGGRGMQVVYNEEQLTEYIKKTITSPDAPPVLIDRFLQRALECEADAISDGGSVFVPAILEHIERTGVHSGDSACVIPTISITDEQRQTINRYTEKIARELGVVGLMNIQYAIENDTVYVLEANPRASRTVPLVSKVCNIQMAKLATEVMVKVAKNEMDIDLSGLRTSQVKLFGVKEAVLPFNMFHEVDPILGPEMLSTGEVLGLADNFAMAFALSQEAAKYPLPTSGTALLSVAGSYIDDLPEIASAFQELGFEILATTKTYARMQKLGIKCTPVDGLPSLESVADLVMNGEVTIVVNTPGSTISRGADVRRAAVRKSIPMLTTIEAARAACAGIAAQLGKKGPTVKSLQAYHKSDG